MDGKNVFYVLLMIFVVLFTLAAIRYGTAV